MKVFNASQKVAIDILNELDKFCLSVNYVPFWILDFSKKIQNKYHLFEHPYTHSLLTVKELIELGENTMGNVKKKSTKIIARQSRTIKNNRF